MKLKHLLYATIASLVFAQAVSAENSAVVVELYTSQGCASCPPADEIMNVLSERDDVIALSLHVDYWDYIGWKDEFADPKNADRQRAYANVAGRRSIYTPEMVINGVTDIVGARPMAVATAIERHKAEQSTISVKLKKNAKTIEISADPLVAGLGDMDVIVLRYQKERAARITRGENAGKTITYSNVTQDWQHLTTWDGRKTLNVEVDAAGDVPFVVLVQAKNHGPILGAAQLR
ncbi:MAG: DUF1223 domain-containing protein [Roseobacter sp.]